MKGPSAIEQKSAPASSSDSRNSSRKKRNNKRSKRKGNSTAEVTSSAPAAESDPSTKRQKLVQPLRGLVVSVSTLKEGVGNPSSDEGAAGYNKVCQIGRDLGAHVTSQVSKRVQLLLCTRSAVDKATQRVRKAYKKKIPIVDIVWLEECRSSGEQVDMQPFRLDKQAEDAITNREAVLASNSDPGIEVDPNAGWTESVSFGCSCVCHENGAEKDCRWCLNGCAT